MNRKIEQKTERGFAIFFGGLAINGWLYVFGFATHILRFKALKPIGKTDIYNVLATGGYTNVN